MRRLLIVDKESRWSTKIPGVEVVEARRYLSDPSHNSGEHTRLFNLCSSFAYQSLGYYVSLLAEARGHRAIPEIITIQDMKSVGLTRAISEELDQLVQHSLRSIKEHEFVLSIYFGTTLAKRDKELGKRLFGMFPAPLLRAYFVRKKKWLVQGLEPVPLDEVPVTHWDDLTIAAQEYFLRKRWSRSKTTSRYSLAILTDPTDKEAPSNERAIKKFLEAASSHNLAAETIDRNDYGHIAEFDALFIRTTTNVNHYTYRFARRAQAEGLAVIDDPLSIARCSNKVFQAEALTGHGIPILPTMILHRGNIDEAAQTLGFPIVVKRPDGCFSLGVSKFTSMDEYLEAIPQFLQRSELLIAQSFTPSDFDWRIGVLDGEPLYACKYYMAQGHWQIISRNGGDATDFGHFETVSVSDVPKKVLATAIRAANVIGDSLYGVDLKQLREKVYVVEVNDNPNIDAGVEDKVLKNKLYDAIISSFVRRIHALRPSTSE